MAREKPLRLRGLQYGGRGQKSAEYNCTLKAPVERPEGLCAVNLANKLCKFSDLSRYSRVTVKSNAKLLQIKK
jgi:hypothetical protein